MTHWAILYTIACDLRKLQSVPTAAVAIFTGDFGCSDVRSESWVSDMSTISNKIQRRFVTILVCLLLWFPAIFRLWFNSQCPVYKMCVSHPLKSGCTTRIYLSHSLSIILQQPSRSLLTPPEWLIGRERHWKSWVLHNIESSWGHTQSYEPTSLPLCILLETAKTF